MTRKIVKRSTFFFQLLHHVKIDLSEWIHSRPLRASTQHIYCVEYRKIIGVTCRFCGVLILFTVLQVLYDTDIRSVYVKKRKSKGRLRESFNAAGIPILLRCPDAFYIHAHEIANVRNKKEWYFWLLQREFSQCSHWLTQGSMWNEIVIRVRGLSIITCVARFDDRGLRLSAQTIKKPHLI